MASSNPLFPGVDHFISLAQAKEMTARYRAEKENILAPQYQGQDILSICETFNRSIFDVILAETDCVGLRIYFGMKPDLKVKTIIVGVNSKGEDILPSATNPALLEGEDGDGDGNIGQDGVPCPPSCPVPPL
ncbi:MAG TPA: hypothetical protein VLJ68_11920 [Chitinophagaceae bacterium]|nr:hypothetical protein [Chitinophagaceae bacterium]